LYTAWKNTKFDVQVVGIVNPSTIAELDPSYSLKKEYFTAYNLGVATYAKYINTSTLVYVVKPIKSYDPKAIDEEKRYYIPETLIDFTRSYAYISARRYNFVANTGIKHYPNVLDEEAFFKVARKSVSKVVGALSPFIADNVSTDVTYVDVLTTQSVLDGISELSEKLISLQEQATKQAKDNTEESERNLYIQRQKAISSQETYLAAQTELLAQLNVVKAQETENTKLNATLNSIKATIVEIVSLIRAGTYSVDNFPTFEELWAQAEENLNK